jgi:hypothetical protein
MNCVFCGDSIGSVCQQCNDESIDRLKAEVSDLKDQIKRLKNLFVGEDLEKFLVSEQDVSDACDDRYMS